MKKFIKKFSIVLLLLISTFSINAQVNDTLAFDASISKSGYAAATVTIGDYDWSLSQAMQSSSPDAGDMKFGTNSLRMRRNAADYGYIQMEEDKPYGLGSISFYASRANFGSDRANIAPIFEAQYSTDAGTTWIPAGSAVDLDGIDALTKFEYSNINVTGNIRVRLIVTGGDSGKRFNIDSLILTGYSPTTVCEKPLNMGVVNNTDGSIDVTWDAPTNLPADGYQVAVFKTGTQPTSADFFKIPSSETNFSTDTLTNGTNLVDSTTYLVYLYSVCNEATVDHSDTIGSPVNVSIIPCDGPTNLVLVDNTDGSITASWTAPAGLPAEGYQIAIVDAGSTPLSSNFFTVPSSETTFTTDTLKNGANLANSSSYDVYIYSSCNTAKEYHSDTINANVQLAACAKPTNLVVVDNGDGSVTVTWDATTPLPGNGYQIALHSNGSTPNQYEYFNILSSETSFTTDTLTNGATLAGGLEYVVTMNAVCDAVNVSAPLNDTLAIILPTTCLSPTGLNAVSNGDGSITISWNVPTNIPSNGYLIAMASDQLVTDSVYISVNDGNQTTITTDTLPNGTQLDPYGNYFVYITSNCGSETSPIDSVAVSVAMPCVEVTNLTVTADADGTIGVTWDAPSYLPSDGYQIAIAVEGTLPTAGDYFDVDKTKTSFSSDTLNNGTAIILGNSYVVYFVSLCSSTQISDTLIDTVQTTALPCLAPSNLTVTNHQDGSIDISWTSATQPTNGYFYAIMPVGTVPSFPGDYVATSATSIANATTTTGSSALTFEAGETYKVYLISSCDSIQGNSGNVTENFTMALSVNTVNSEITGLFPNPTSSTLTIEMSASVGYVTIIDLTGKVVYTNEMTSNTTKINVEELPAGMYQVKVATTTATSFGKFIKE